MEVQAFLTMPDLAAMQIEHCEVIKPFSIEAAVDRCVEPTITGTYRSDCFVLGQLWAYSHVVSSCLTA